MIQDLMDRLLYRFSFDEEFQHMSLDDFEYQLRYSKKKHTAALNALFLYPLALGVFFAFTQPSTFLVLIAALLVLGGGFGIMHSLFPTRIIYTANIVLAFTYLIYLLYCLIFRPCITIPGFSWLENSSGSIVIPFSLITGLLGVLCSVLTVCSVFALEHIERYDIMVIEMKKERERSKNRLYSKKAIYRDELEPIYYEEIVAKYGEESLDNLDNAPGTSGNLGQMEEIVYLNEIKGLQPDHIEWKTRPQATSAGDSTDDDSEDAVLNNTESEA